MQFLTHAVSVSCGLCFSGHCPVTGVKSVCHS